RVFLPGLAAHLPGLGNGIEVPPGLAGTHIERLGRPRRRLPALGRIRHRSPDAHADDDDVATDLGRAGPRVARGARTEARPQIHPSVVAEGRHRFPRARVERDQVLATDDEQTALAAVAPWRHAACAVAAQ